MLSAVLNDEPAWERLPSGTPEHVRALLARCLDKDPRTRLRDVGEARGVLERPPPSPAPVALSSRRPVWLLAVSAGLALLVLGTFLGRWIAGRTPSASPPLSLHPLTGLAGMEETPALSPDGEKVAFVSCVDSKRQVFLQTQGAPQAITEGPAEHSFPRWVDEGTLIYFRHPSEGAPGAHLEKIVFSASPTRTVLEPAWGETDVSHDGRFLATFRMDEGRPALVIVERRGERSPVVHRMPHTACGAPRWSPDDRSLAFQSLTYLGEHTQLLVLDVQTGTARVVRDLASNGDQPADTDTPVASRSAPVEPR